MSQPGHESCATRDMIPWSYGGIPGYVSVCRTIEMLRIDKGRDRIFLRPPIYDD